MAGGQCALCGREELLPFRCRYCAQPHCSDHRLPENHACRGLQEPGAREHVVLRRSPADASGGGWSGGWPGGARGAPRGGRREPVPVKVRAGLPGGDTVERIRRVTRRSTTHLLLVAIGAVFLLQILGGIALGLLTGVGAGAGVGIMQCALALGQCSVAGVGFTSAPWALVEKPWTLVTNLFAHHAFIPFHILFNALYLYFFGLELERRIGSRSLLRLFLGAGVVAAVGQVAIFDGAVLGASGAVMGILGALTLLAPNLRVLFFFVPLPLWVMTLLFIFLDLGGLAGGSAGVANLAHLLGLAVGAAYGLRLKKRGVMPRVTSNWAMNRRSW